MQKEKILIVLPYGMCVRQIILNQDLWNYLIGSYQVDIMTPSKISNDIKGINEIIDPMPKNFLLKIFYKISRKSLFSFQASKMVNFFLDNNIGENFALRWRWFGDYAKHIVVMSGLVNIKFIGSFIKNYLSFLTKIYPIFFLKKNNYNSIIVTHISDLDCALMGIGANKLEIPLISITLGLDNYAHGPLMFKPNLMLLWGEEQLEEFKDYHLEQNEDFLDIEYTKIGSLIHDNYLKIKEKNTKNYLLKNYSLDCNQKFILVAVMNNEVLSNQVDLCKLLLNYLDNKNLKHKLLIRKLPLIDNDIWNKFYLNYKERIVIQEPRSAAFDKRTNGLEFDLKSSAEDVEELVQTLERSDLVVGLYPSTLLLDAMLFDKQSVVAMFDWTEKQKIGGHPQEKFYLSKQFTHEHRQHYNLVYNKESLFLFLDDVLIKEKSFPEYRREIFKKITGDSSDGLSGKKAVKAIDKFLKKY
tara:strand:- start:972 stop:2378 length:1407 start_codon:yes stop_codon:yes gene_type:complete